MLLPSGIRPDGVIAGPDMFAPLPNLQVVQDDLSAFVDAQVEHKVDPAAPLAYPSSQARHVSIETADGVALYFPASQPMQ